MLKSINHYYVLISYLFLAIGFIAVLRAKSSEPDEFSVRGHRVRGLVGILAMSTLLGLASIIGEGGLSDTTKEAIYKDSKGDKTEAIAEPSNNTSAGHQCTLQQTMPIVVSVPTVCQPTICSCIAAGKSKNKAGAAKTKIVEPSDSVNCK